AVASYTVRGRDPDFLNFRRAVKGLLHKLDERPTAIHLLGIASEVAETLEDYGQRTATYIRQQSEQMRSIVAMLSDTLADVSGQAQASVGRLQAIEQQIERASGLDDMQELIASLDRCLALLRDAVAHQRAESANTIQRLREQIHLVQKHISTDHL